MGAMHPNSNQYDTTLSAGMQVPVLRELAHCVYRGRYGVSPRYKWRGKRRAPGGTSNRGAAAPCAWSFQGGESREGGNRNPPSLVCLWFLSAQAERNAPGRADNDADRNRFDSEEDRSAAISDGERPPAGPFLNDQKGAKESVKEGDCRRPKVRSPLFPPKGEKSVRSLVSPPPNTPHSVGLVLGTHLDNPPLKTNKHRENRDPNGAQRSGSIWERRGKGAE